MTCQNWASNIIMLCIFLFRVKLLTSLIGNCLLFFNLKSFLPKLKILTRNTAVHFVIFSQINLFLFIFDSYRQLSLIQTWNQFISVTDPRSKHRLYFFSATIFTRISTESHHWRCEHLEGRSSTERAEAVLAHRLQMLWPGHALLSSAVATAATKRQPETWYHWWDTRHTRDHRVLGPGSGSWRNPGIGKSQSYLSNFWPSLFSFTFGLKVEWVDIGMTLIERFNDLIYPVMYSLFLWTMKYEVGAEFERKPLPLLMIKYCDVELVMS